MDDTSLNADPSLQILFPLSVLSTSELDVLIRRTSPVIQITTSKCLEKYPPLFGNRVAKKVLIELMQNRKLWIFVEGDKEYCLPNDPTVDSAEEWKLWLHDVDTDDEILDDELQRPSRTSFWQRNLDP
ncbi:hypothetical protein C8R44DRAFT_869366 [Mycena epipterygia]|nr:hypothetical protein C8R44DRAFT_869366 [Mycena epipterygia]